MVFFIVFDLGQGVRGDYVETCPCCDIISLFIIFPACAYFINHSSQIDLADITSYSLSVTKQFEYCVFDEGAY